MDYFRHDIKASEDDKILDLLSRGGYEQLGYYWRFVEYLYGQGGSVSCKRIKSVAWALHMDADTLEEVLYNYGLFECDGENVYSPRVIETLNAYAEKGKRMSELGRASAEARSQRAVERAVERAVNEQLSAPSTEEQRAVEQNKIKYNKIKYNKEKDVEKEKSGEKRKRFIAPTREEVEAYAKEKGRDDLAAAFYEYFETGGWKDSKGEPVRNWKQKFLTWANHSEKKEKGSFDTDEFFEAAVKRSERGGK